LITDSSDLFRGRHLHFTEVTVRHSHRVVLKYWTFRIDL